MSASVVDLNSGKTLVAIDDRIVLPTASIGKILLLIEVSARLTARDLPGLGIMDKTPLDAIGDSGLWQHLQVPSLPATDLAALVGATSDNLATNVLLRQVGLAAVRARTESLGLTRTALLDLVRDRRGPDDAPQLSVGSTAELSWLFGALARNEIVDPVTSQRVLGWLSLNSDTSMVAGAFALDPLAHRGVDHDTLLVNKTGTDTGVRAEAGALRGSGRAVAYAVTVQFTDDNLAARMRVLEAMRVVGVDLLEYVHQARPEKTPQKH
ncbi:serine hydrolase [Salinibacterium sp. G-O1]|uniref:serine hydrolase n=1 Tax=Salinibacterium sp. G-O1 TaxID=3046208 RepID=UPI0024B9E6CE|nr:serine hydrolase [Salinibacterium sp. G-O1]MDJ0333645.1 serine hydrolase [Salinibacterium sp. G-O1]